MVAGTKCQQYGGEQGGHCGREVFPQRWDKYNSTHHIQASHLETTALTSTPVIGVDSWLSCVTLGMTKHKIPAPQDPAWLWAVSTTAMSGEKCWNKVGRAELQGQLRWAQPNGARSGLKYKPQSLLTPPAAGLSELEDGWVQSNDFFLGQNHTDRAWHHFHWSRQPMHIVAVNAHFLSFQAHEFYLCPNFSAFTKFCSYRTSLCSPFLKKNF